MLPPVDPALFAVNPRFEALYHDLCTQKLNRDGTTRLLDSKALKDREAFSDDLHKARKDAENKRLAQDGLQNIASGASDLPDELRELSAIILAILRNEIPDEDLEVVGSEIAKFKDEEKIKPIANALSKQMLDDTLRIARLLEPSNPAPNISGLPLAIQELQDEVYHVRHELAQVRVTLGNTIYEARQLYCQIVEISIRLLEQTIHGSVSRATRAKADYISTVAEAMAKKLNVQHAQLLQQVYIPEIQSLLKVKIGETEQEKIALRRKIRDAEAELEKYRAIKGAEGMAAEYAAVLRETETVKHEIARMEQTTKPST